MTAMTLPNRRVMHFPVTRVSHAKDKIQSEPTTPTTPPSKRCVPCMTTPSTAESSARSRAWADFEVNEDDDLIFFEEAELPPLAEIPEFPCTVSTEMKDKNPPVVLSTGFIDATEQWIMQEDGANPMMKRTFFECVQALEKAPQKDHTVGRAEALKLIKIFEKDFISDGSGGFSQVRELLLKEFPRPPQKKKTQAQRRAGRRLNDPV